MDNFQAVGIAEGFIAPRDHNEVIEAWQHLVDTGLVWHLQGWFDLVARRMIRDGVLRDPHAPQPTPAPVPAQKYPLTVETLEAFLREEERIYNDLDAEMPWWEAYAIDAAAHFGVNETCFATKLQETKKAHEKAHPCEHSHWAHWYADYIINGPADMSEPAEQITKFSALAAGRAE